MKFKRCLCEEISGLEVRLSEKISSKRLGDVILSEIFKDSANPSADNGYEWVELYNNGSSAVDLSGYSLDWGGTDYTTGTLQLSGNCSFVKISSHGFYRLFISGSLQSLFYFCLQ